MAALRRSQRIKNQERTNDIIASCKLDLIGNGCTGLVLSFLRYREMNKFSSVSPSFNRILNREKDRYIKNSILHHPAFINFFFGSDHSTKIKYAVQNRYRIRNRFEFKDEFISAFEEMGERGELAETEQKLWEILKHFGWSYQIVQWSYDVDGGWFETGPETDVNFGHDISHIGGLATTAYSWKLDDDIDDSCAAVVFYISNIPDRAWRDEFLSRNVTGDLYNHLLMIHPLFAEYRDFIKTNKNKEFEIGYWLQNSYLHHSSTLKDVTEGGKLEKMDGLIWRLCAHFGFEAELYLIVGDYRCPVRPTKATMMRRHEYIDRIAKFPNNIPESEGYLELGWDDDRFEWRKNDLDATYGYENGDTDIGSIAELSYSSSGITWATNSRLIWPILRITCPAGECRQR